MLILAHDLEIQFNTLIKIIIKNVEKYILMEVEYRVFLVTNLLLMYHKIVCKIRNVNMEIGYVPNISYIVNIIISRSIFNEYVQWNNDYFK